MLCLHIPLLFLAPPLSGPLQTEVVNTGTWESALRAMRTAGELRKYRKGLGSSRLLEPQPANTSIPKRRSVFYSPVAGRWCVPFPGPDLSCVSSPSLSSSLMMDIVTIDKTDCILPSRFTQHTTS